MYSTKFFPHRNKQDKVRKILNIAISQFSEKGTLRDKSGFVTNWVKIVNRKLESFTYKKKHTKNVSQFYFSNFRYWLRTGPQLSVQSQSDRPKSPMQEADEHECVR